MDENKVFELFNTQSDWKIHLKGLKFKESEHKGVLRVVSYPLLDLIRNYPKVAEFVFSKMMKIVIRDGYELLDMNYGLIGELHFFI